MDKQMMIERLRGTDTYHWSISSVLATLIIVVFGGIWFLDITQGLKLQLVYVILFVLLCCVILCKTLRDRSMAMGHLADESPKVRMLANGLSGTPAWFYGSTAFFIVSLLWTFWLLWFMNISRELKLFIITAIIALQGVIPAVSKSIRDRADCESFPIVIEKQD